MTFGISYIFLSMPETNYSSCKWKQKGKSLNRCFFTLQLLREDERFFSKVKKKIVRKKTRKMQRI